jgi:hypothetical protein
VLATIPQDAWTVLCHNWNRKIGTWYFSSTVKTAILVVRSPYYLDETFNKQW